MLYYGDASNIQDQCTILNLSSFIEGYQKLNLLPPNSLGATNEYQFDQLYAKSIMEDDYLFSQMFSIIYLLSIGQDVYIIISNDDWSENVAESLFKLIQQRYGYNASRINCFDDIVNASPSDFEPSYGIFNLDQDMERFTYITKLQSMNGGTKQ
ncbi:MAG: hypothetical protein NC310_09035 [Roseburia sp.]|nr:hypothetical protein [Roseburia sp.]